MHDCWHEALSIFKIVGILGGELKTYLIVNFFVGIFCGANVNIFVSMAMIDILSTMTHAY